MGEREEGKIHLKLCCLSSQVIMKCNEALCGVSTLAGHQNLTKLLSHYSPSFCTWGAKFNEKLIHLGKDVDIYHQLLSQAKRIQFGED